ncbi:MAG TPA: hypothetical protein VHN37_02465 [Actinomycetota bacterium]|nr:hypothetical protein [Actinomycetota bacterium]
MTSPSKFGHYPVRPRAGECSASFTILCNAHDAASSFLDAFESLRKNRNAKGTPTDEEQDLLRATVIFSSSGLDALAKQLVKDALPRVIDNMEGAEKMLKSHVERRLRRGDKEAHQLLADVMVDRDPRGTLVSTLVYDLTSGSLQSYEELVKVASHFDIPSREIVDDVDSLRSVFAARNQIIHEMDVDLAQVNRNRRPRKKKDMVGATNSIFAVSQKLLNAVDARIGASSLEHRG